MSRAFNRFAVRIRTNFALVYGFAVFNTRCFSCRFNCVFMLVVGIFCIKSKVTVGHVGGNFAVPADKFHALRVKLYVGSDYFISDK